MATERLRKRLKSSQHPNSTEGGAGLGASSRGHENFCLVGTPLPALGSSKRDVNEFKPVWKQEVYDEQGRQRFHGAFTGGWSAGYFNTVGSKEGWTPSSFRSSRKDRTQGDAAKDSVVVAQSVEDFMDEEDKSDFRQGRGALKTNDAYNAAHQQHNEGRGEADPLMGLFGLGESAKSLHIQASTIGFQILRRMGWQDGQGLGPNMSVEHKTRLCAMLGLPWKETNNEENPKGLAPPDTPLVEPKTVQRKDRHGLGWNSSDQPATLADILRTQRHSRDTTQEGGQRAPDDRESILPDRNTDTSRTGSESKGGNRWHDGSPMIAGFRISQESLPLEKWYAATTVPVGWKPDPRRVWSESGSPAEKHRLDETRSTPASNPSERAAALGEARAPGPPPAISDYISIKDRQRLLRAKEAASSDDHNAVQGVHHEAPKLSRHQAQNALQGYMPFGNDPAKQQRYRTYLQTQANPDDNIALKPTPGQTYDQFRHELDEFAKSALIFKPMSTMMANRFESSSTTTANDAGDQPRPGLYIPPQKEEKEKEQPSQAAGKAGSVREEEKDRQEEEGMTSMQRNARMGLFGPNTTREVLVWKPSRLLCKRFNVPLPYREEVDANESRNEGEPGTIRSEEAYDEFGSSLGRRKPVMNVNSRWETSKRQLQQAAASRAWESNGAGYEELSRGVPKEEGSEDRGQSPTEQSFDLAKVGLGHPDEEGEETAYVRPPTELFKAIFADDEEDEGNLPSQSEEVSTDGSMEKRDDVTRLRFVPRPKRADLSNDPSAGADQTPPIVPGRPSSAHATVMPKKKSKRDQKRGNSRLSFQIDDEEEDNGNGGREGQGKTKERSSTKSRPLASDLFDV